MESALKNLAAVVSAAGTDGASTLADTLPAWLEQMDPVQYACLGCAHCYPAVAQNAFTQAFPALEEAAADLSCDFRVREERWPPVAGEYFVLNEAGPVAVSTLASVQLAEELARRRSEGLAIVGKTETENIGIDKIIKNVVTSPTLRHLIVAGTDSGGHFAGQTLLALAENGIDEQGRVIGSRGKRPILRNVSAPEIEAFRQQVQVVDMIGCEDPGEIVARIEELSQQVTMPCGCSECDETSPVTISTAPTLRAGEPGEVATMDRAGYFVILPLPDRELINVEHYAYDNTLLRVIEGRTARAIYQTLIEEGWVSELSHATYLGKELARAELSLEYGFRYVQDGA